MRVGWMILRPTSLTDDHCTYRPIGYGSALLRCFPKLHKVRLPTRLRRSLTLALLRKLNVLARKKMHFSCKDD